jgi:hypothetical protein
MNRYEVTEKELVSMWRRAILAFAIGIALTAALVIGVAVNAGADPLPFRNDQYIPPIVQPQPQPKCGPEIEQTPNFGPNVQYPQPPINPPVQSIHPAR